jgi:uncharacterized phage-associated protein
MPDYHPEKFWKPEQRGAPAIPDSPPYDPRAVANLLLDTADGLGIDISNLALQKLLYFAHGHFLIQTGVPLVQGGFEAWNNGPVHPAVYHAFKAVGRAPIRMRASGRNVMTGEPKALLLPQSPDVRHHLNRVLAWYGHLSPGLLVAISHAPKGPWAVVREQVTHGTSLGARIPDSLTTQRFHYQKIVVGNGREVDDLADDEPLVAIQASDCRPKRL